MVELIEPTDYKVTIYINSQWTEEQLKIHLQKKFPLNKGINIEKVKML